MTMIYAMGGPRTVSPPSIRFEGKKQPEQPSKSAETKQGGWLKSSLMALSLMGMAGVAMQSNPIQGAEPPQAVGKVADPAQNAPTIVNRGKLAFQSSEQFRFFSVDDLATGKRYKLEGATPEVDKQLNANLRAMLNDTPGAKPVVSVRGQSAPANNRGDLKLIISNPNMVQQEDVHSLMSPVGLTTEGRQFFIKSKGQGFHFAQPSTEMLGAWFKEGATATAFGKPNEATHSFNATDGVFPQVAYNTEFQETTSHKPTRPITSKSITGTVRKNGDNWGLVQADGKAIQLEGVTPAGLAKWFRPGAVVNVEGLKEHGPNTIMQGTKLEVSGITPVAPNQYQGERLVTGAIRVTMTGRASIPDSSANGQFILMKDQSTPLIVRDFKTQDVVEIEGRAGTGTVTIRDGDEGDIKISGTPLYVQTLKKGSNDPLINSSLEQIASVLKKADVETTPFVGPDVQNPPLPTPGADGKITRAELGRFASKPFISNSERAVAAALLRNFSRFAEEHSIHGGPNPPQGYQAYLRSYITNGDAQSVAGFDKNPKSISNDDLQGHPVDNGPPRPLQPPIKK